MSPEQIKKAVEDFPNLLEKQDKLQKRLINLSGRDPEQEFAIMQRLEPLERLTELIDCAVYEDGILTPREECVVLHRTEGKTVKEISDFFSLTHQGVSAILERAYKKMADAAKVPKIG